MGFLLDMFRRKDAWLKRDKNLYCPLHPSIHPDNIEKIKLRRVERSEKDGDVIVLKTVVYCPKCFGTVREKVKKNEEKK